MSAGLDDGLAVRQVAPSFAAEITGMPVHGEVDAGLFARLVGLLHRYRVLVVPGLRLGRGGGPRPHRGATNPASKYVSSLVFVC